MTLKIKQLNASGADSGDAIMFDGTNLGYSSSSTVPLRLPSGTTRPQSPAAGFIWFNSTLEQAEVYTGTAWIRIDAGATVNNVDLTSTGSTLAVTGSPITTDGTINLEVQPNTTNQLTKVTHNGTVIASRGTINLIDGTNATLTVADNVEAGSVDVTIAASGGGSPNAATRYKFSVAIAPGTANLSTAPGAITNIPEGWNITNTTNSITVTTNLGTPPRETWFFGQTANKGTTQVARVNSTVTNILSFDTANPNVFTLSSITASSTGAAGSETTAPFDVFVYF